MRLRQFGRRHQCHAQHFCSHALPHPACRIFAAAGQATVPIPQPELITPLAQCPQPRLTLSIPSLLCTKLEKGSQGDVAATRKIKCPGPCAAGDHGLPHKSKAGRSLTLDSWKQKKQSHKRVSIAYCFLLNCCLSTWSGLALLQVRRGRGGNKG